MAISVFKRYEKKFLLTLEQYRNIVDFLSDYMVFDKYCVNEQVYGLLNVYFDTPNNLLIGISTDKPIYKEKLRLRSYFVPESNDSKVFFEIKKKYNKCVTKRRAVMTYGEALELIRTHEPPPSLKKESYINRQVIKEICQMFKRYEGLAPMVFIAYDRIAMFGKDDPELRVTFDKNIRTRRDDPTFEGGTDGDQLLPEDKILMEIKIPETLPLWLVNYLSENEIFTTSFSKYGKEYQYHLTDDTKNITQLSEDD